MPRLPVVCPAPNSRVESTITFICSAATPSSSTATWRATLCTPWPISVQQWRTSRVPSGSNLTTAFAISSKPFPSPEFFSPKPIPTGNPARTASSYAGFTASRHARAPRHPSSIICPGPQMSPGSTTLRDRISQPLIPTFSANRSIMPSIANWAWLAPNPLKAPQTGLLVRAATASTSTAWSTYGPVAWPAARSRTFIPTDAYGPESPSILARRPVSFPFSSQPAS